MIEFKTFLRACLGLLTSFMSKTTLKEQCVPHGQMAVKWWATSVYQLQLHLHCLVAATSPALQAQNCVLPTTRLMPDTCRGSTVPPLPITNITNVQRSSNSVLLTHKRTIIVKLQIITSYGTFHSVYLRQQQVAFRVHFRTVNQLC